jgi:hypothetical protein
LLNLSLAEQEKRLKEYDDLIKKSLAISQIVIRALKAESATKREEPRPLLELLFQAQLEKEKTDEIVRSRKSYRSSNGGA